MARSTKNPWIGAGLAAGLAIAGALVLVWPSPAKIAAPALAKDTSARDACRKCEEKHCKILVDACFPAKGAEPARFPESDAITPEMTKGCQEVTECFRQTNCADELQGVCYCGDGVDMEQCFAGHAEAKGPCKDVIERHGGSKNPVELSDRFSDAKYALGLAGLLRLCDDSPCKEACQ